MTGKNNFHIAVLPGDGIGVDVTDEALRVLDAVEDSFGTFKLRIAKYDAGAGCYKKTGNDLPPETLIACCQAHAIFLGAMGLPNVRKPDGTELMPQVTLRTELDLYAGVRPCKLYEGARTPLANVKPGDIDLVILREQTEGLFASQNCGIVLNDQVATETMVMTRRGIERICEFAFLLSEQRTRAKEGACRKVTCVDKANVFKSFALFRKIFHEIGNRHSHVEKQHAYVDAQSLHLIQKPESFDVIVTENMFGDILSELAAGLIGGMGMAPSADIGDNHAVFQPAHGTAPDIAGKGIANPIAAILSAGMMLDWLGRRYHNLDLVQAAVRVEQAVSDVLGEGKLRPVDQGGSATTVAMGKAIADRIKKME